MHRSEITHEMLENAGKFIKETNERFWQKTDEEIAKMFLANQKNHKLSRDFCKDLIDKNIQKLKQFGFSDQEILVDRANNFDEWWMEYEQAILSLEAMLEYIMKDRLIENNLSTESFKIQCEMFICLTK